MWAGIPIIGGVLTTLIERVFPDPARDAEAKAKLIEAVSQLSATEITAQSEIIKAEAASEGWLAANWRPITMLVFLGLIVSAWFGYVPSHMPAATLDILFQTVQYGLCGYVGGRSVEKSVTNIAKVLKK